jgi:hypothetical protein
MARASKCHLTHRTPVFVTKHVRIASIIQRLRSMSRSCRPVSTVGVGNTATDVNAAQIIFQALGVKDNIGFDQHGAAHCSSHSVGLAGRQAFIQRNLRRLSVTSEVWTVTSTTSGSNGATVDVTKWVGWAVPTPSLPGTLGLDTEARKEQGGR